MSFRMQTQQLLIVGHSPGKVEQAKSPTRNRVRRWLHLAGIQHYDWSNLVHYHTTGLKMSEVTLEPSFVRQYAAVIALGRSAAEWLGRQGIPHLAVPHPSGLNRAWNDPAREPHTIQQIKEYLEKHRSRTTQI